MTDHALWLLGLVSGVLAAAIGIIASYLDRKASIWPTAQQRFYLHMASYVILSLSIVSFIIRGLLIPS
jgi:uncharacterized membrane protein